MPGISYSPDQLAVFFQRLLRAGIYESFAPSANAQNNSAHSLFLHSGSAYVQELCNCLGSETVTSQSAKLWLALAILRFADPTQNEHAAALRSLSEHGREVLEQAIVLLEQSSKNPQYVFFQNEKVDNPVSYEKIQTGLEEQELSSVLSKLGALREILSPAPASANIGGAAGAFADPENPLGLLPWGRARFRTASPASPRAPCRRQSTLLF